MKDIAKRVFDIEIESLQQVAALIDDAFTAVVNAILANKGKVIVIGLGKSGLIGKKIAATFSSTGTPSFFLHPGDAFHGDLGIVGANDPVLLISYSGETDEVLRVIPFLKWNNNLIISITGNPNSTIAKNSDHHLNINITREACPLALAPTSSTTATLVMGDALAVCLLSVKGFTEKDFARYHPGGALGKRLYLRVADMSDLNEQPKVKPGSTLREIIYEISGKRLGATAVLDDNGKLLGIITDGDLRRMLEKNESPGNVKAADILSVNPKTIEGNELATEALALMRRHDITQLIVTRDGKYAGMLHLHDLVREGII